ncbi:hypothetical protein CHH80_11370 [Bacillus sp. 7504-2]|nr:hypothetical protein CHH80_11370 [Bacillus sp. 7504-2]
MYSSHQIEKQLGENIYFIWISGNQKPDFQTISHIESTVEKDMGYKTKKGEFPFFSP